MGTIKSILVAAVACLVLAGSAAAQWQAPADGTLTEKQLDGFLAVVKELQSTAAEGESGGMAAAMIAAVTGGEAIQTAVAKHDMTVDEFQWVTSQVVESWSAMAVKQIAADTDAGMDEQVKESEAQIAEAKQAVVDADKAIAEASDDAAKAAAELDKEEALATVDLHQASLAQLMASHRLMAVQAKRMTSNANEANVQLVAKRKAELDEAFGEGDDMDDEGDDDEDEDDGDEDDEDDDK